ncbi:hypothetical protein ASG11_07620 [Sphingomonas sp. Leaf357]|uniref:hypothetical protein n=1 Tax=Sphingomonas sp. Leaf357 TaxID=1736350 RepID=UPI0006F204C5|nr:hypothetical protein [Sphingomonas sp. Leaf357]KQS04130.1 hypothetical protein ASG11_07620 [Sphingomonas sp. Leaf357]
MAGATDSRAMTETAHSIAAKRQRLDRMLDQFPQEMAKAAHLAAEQAAAIAVLAVPTEPAP